MLKISAFLFNTSVDLHDASTTFSCCNIRPISHHWWSNLIWFMNEKLFNVKLSLIPPHYTRYDRVYAPAINYPVYSQKWYPGLGSWLIACCKLAPTLARQMWRHNYVIDLNFLHCQTLSILGYIHCNFRLNPQIIHGDMKENVSGCFFLNTV